VPGTYQIKLTAGGKSLTASAEIQKDPRVNVSQADLEKQYELATRIRDRVGRGNEAVNQMRSVREQLDGLKKRLSGDAGATAVLDSAEALRKKIDAVEEIGRASCRERVGSAVVAGGVERKRGVEDGG